MLLVHQQQQRRRRRPGWQLWPQDTQRCTSVAPVPAARTVKDTHLIRPLNSRVAAAAQSVCSWQRGRRSGGGGAGPQVKCKFVGAAFTTARSGVCVVHFRPWAMLGGARGALSVTRACWGTCAMCLLRLGRAGVCVCVVHFLCLGLSAVHFM